MEEGLNVSFDMTADREGGAQTLQDAEDRVRLLEERIRKDAQEIIEVLRVDLPEYVAREVKAQFLACAEYAKGLSDGQVRAIKQSVESERAKVRSELIPTLEEWGIWYPDDAAVEKAETSDLGGNAAVWARVQRVGEHVLAVLRAGGFPGIDDARFKEAYRLPTWFIAKRFMKSLVESYWRNVREYASLKAAIRRVKEKEERDRLAERWDTA